MKAVTLRDIASQVLNVYAGGKTYLGYPNNDKYACCAGASLDGFVRAFITDTLIEVGGTGVTTTSIQDKAIDKLNLLADKVERAETCKEAILLGIVYDNTE